MSWLRRAGVRSLWGILFLLALLPRTARAEDRFQYGALLRDEGGPGVEDVSCKKYNEQEERSRETDPDQERHYLDPPNVYEPFALARLLVTWEDKRLVKIQRKELGVKCCLTLEETCREPLSKDDE